MTPFISKLPVRRGHHQLALIVLLFSFSLGLTAAHAATVTQHPGSSYIVFEAEIGTPLTHNSSNYWLTISDVNANGGAAIEGFKTSGPGTQGQTVFDLYMTNAGTYKLYHRSRIINENGGGITDNDSFLRGTNFGFAPNIAIENPGGVASYAWRLNSAGTNYTVSGPAIYTFSISPRETGATVDTIVFSTDFGLTSSQLDSIVLAGNIPEPNAMLLAALAGVLGFCRRRRHV